MSDQPAVEAAYKTLRKVHLLDSEENFGALETLRSTITALRTENERLTYNLTRKQARIRTLEKEVKPLRETLEYARQERAQFRALWEAADKCPMWSEEHGCAIALIPQPEPTYTWTTGGSSDQPDTDAVDGALRLVEHACSDVDGQMQVTIRGHSAYRDAAAVLRSTITALRAENERLREAVRDE